jgi:phosphoglycolate phosphatase
MNVIFDLDGTLIDSSDSILNSMKVAFEQCDITPCQPFLASLIGPPLHVTLATLAGTDNPDVITQLATRFMAHYDSVAYKKAVVFDGIDKMLNDLISQGYTLYLLTNKRIIPTLKIINYLSWETIFKGVYALDQLEHTKNKTELIAHVVDINHLDKTNTVYIGDTEADRLATHHNGLHYLMVTWGYGHADLMANDCVDIPELINQKVIDILS